ncbi:MAG TPA: hypothetical protein VN327_13070 [Pseudonocardiaceae bacterium]|nr:hypothetical protein [Pseudonocardiaceae bacterium]
MDSWVFRAAATFGDKPREQSVTWRTQAGLTTTPGVHAAHASATWSASTLR